jgi:hypothetical protein
VPGPDLSFSGSTPETDAARDREALTLYLSPGAGVRTGDKLRRFLQTSSVAGGSLVLRDRSLGHFCPEAKSVGVRLDPDTNCERFFFAVLTIARTQSKGFLDTPSWSTSLSTWATTVTWRRHGETVSVHAAFRLRRRLCGRAAIDNRAPELAMLETRALWLGHMFRGRR